MFQTCEEAAGTSLAHADSAPVTPPRTAGGEDAGPGTCLSRNLELAAKVCPQLVGSLLRGAVDVGAVQPVGDLVHLKVNKENMLPSCVF